MIITKIFNIGSVNAFAFPQSIETPQSILSSRVEARSFE